MKSKALAAFIGLLCTPLLQAQTQITLYGVIDAGIQISDAGKGSQASLASGIADGSRFGMKGTEELGGGYKAIFNLEARFETDNGGNTTGYLTDNVSHSLIRGLSSFLPDAAIQGRIVPLLQPEKVVNPLDALFDRTAYVGLVTPIGAFLLGRQYTPAYEVAGLIDPFMSGTAAGWSNVAMGPGGIVTIGMAPRVNNALQYRIETPNGFGASLMVAATSTENARSGTGTGGINYSKRFWGANLKYQANGINAGIGYNQETDQFGNKSLNSLSAGGSYELGNAKFFAGYIRMRNDNPILYDAALSRLPSELGSSLITAIANQISENTRVDADSYTLGAQYRIGANRFTANISRTTSARLGDAKAMLYGIGYSYFLSKRTDLYAVAAYVENRDDAQYALGGAGYLGGFTSRPGKDANAFQFGIRHKF